MNRGIAILILLALLAVFGLPALLKLFTQPTEASWVGLIIGGGLGVVTSVLLGIDRFRNTGNPPVTLSPTTYSRLMIVVVVASLILGRFVSSLSPDMEATLDSIMDFWFVVTVGFLILLILYNWLEA